MSARFRSVFRALLPRWLGGGPDPKRPPSGALGPPQWDDGRKVAYALGVMKDAFVERTRVGLLSRLPEYATTSALNVIGRDRRMIRGVGESDSAWARRLVQWRFPRGHRVRGNPFALLTQIRAYLNVPVRVRTVDRRGNWYEIAADGTESYYWDRANWDWGAFDGSDWARFWVIIYSTGADAPWGLRTWGSPAKWGVGKWGTTASDGDVQSIATMVREWKPEGTMRETVIVSFDDALFDPEGPSVPTADWENYSVNDAGTQVAVRSPDAKYWYVRPV